jgi:hypothetical protein
MNMKVAKMNGRFTFVHKPVFYGHTLPDDVAMLNCDTGRAYRVPIESLQSAVNKHFYEDILDDLYETGVWVSQGYQVVCLPNAPDPAQRELLV